MKKENKKIAMLILFTAILAFIATPVLAGGNIRGRLNDRIEIEQLLINENFTVADLPANAGSQIPAASRLRYRTGDPTWMSPHF